MTGMRRAGRGPALAAAALAFLSALLTAYWTMGGTWLLSTVGGEAEALARRGGPAATTVGVVVVLLKLAGGCLALALVGRRRGRRTERLLEVAGLAAGVLLAAYGGLLVLVGGLVLTGVVGPAPSDTMPLRWHVLVWDPWFLMWGLLLLLAVRRRRHSGPCRG